MMAPDQCVFIVPLWRLIVLRGAWLMNRTARMTLTSSRKSGVLSLKFLKE
jgi:hypothetical protein